MRRQAKDRKGTVLPEGWWKLISLTLDVEPSLGRVVVPELPEALTPGSMIHGSHRPSAEIEVSRYQLYSLSQPPGETAFRHQASVLQSIGRSTA